MYQSTDERELKKKVVALNSVLLSIWDRISERLDVTELEYGLHLFDFEDSCLGVDIFFNNKYMDMTDYINICQQDCDMYLLKLLQNMENTLIKLGYIEEILIKESDKHAINEILYLWKNIFFINRIENLPLYIRLFKVYHDLSQSMDQNGKYDDIFDELLNKIAEELYTSPYSEQNEHIWPFLDLLYTNLTPKLITMFDSVNQIICTVNIQKSYHFYYIDLRSAICNFLTQYPDSFDEFFRFMNTQACADFIQLLVTSLFNAFEYNPDIFNSEVKHKIMTLSNALNEEFNGEYDNIDDFMYNQYN